MTRERRSWRRVATRGMAAWVRSPRGVTCDVSNLSVRGALLRGADFPVGVSLAFELQTPDGMPCDIEGRVVRQDAEGVGVVFEPLSPLAQVVLLEIAG